MSQKEQVEEMLNAGKGYDEIEDQTGSARSYIRSIAVGYRKRTAKDEPEEPKEREPETLKPKEEEEKLPGMNFFDDDPKSKDVKTDHNTGAQHHKAWVKAAKYECGTCGATIGKSESFCPHCGETLIWEGIE